MRPNDSFQYDKPAQYRQSYQATAAKSPQKRRVEHTQQFTPTKFSKKPSDRINELKNSINNCIQSLSNKKQMNREALQQVKDVNRQIIENLSGQQPGRQYRSSQRPYDEYEQPHHRTEYAPRYDPRGGDKQRQNVTLSSFHLGPQVDNQGRLSQFQTSQVYRPQSASSGQFEAQQLRQKIRNQRVQNQSLQRQFQSLQNAQQQILAQTSNFGFQQDPYVVSQNSRLRQQLDRLNSQSNIQEVYRQFQQLKQDNQRLRKETINLLKNGRY